MPPPKARSIRGQPRLRKECDFISLNSEEADEKEADLAVGGEAVKEGFILLAEYIVGKF